MRNYVTILSVLVVMLAGGTVFSLVRVQQDLAVVHQIQCTAKVDYQKNLRATLKFLRQHPNGTADFSRAFILNAISQDRQKVRSLASLSCS